MGGAWDFNCPKCKYSASVSGGPDSGFAGHFQTMVCSNCKELHNILVEADDSFYGREAKNRVGKCPTCKKKKGLTVWDSENMPCPKCGTRMIRDEKSFVLWD